MKNVVLKQQIFLFWSVQSSVWFWVMWFKSCTHGVQLKLICAILVWISSNSSKSVLGVNNPKAYDYRTSLVFGFLLYSDHLNIRLVWYSNGRFVPGCQMVWCLNGGLKTRPKRPVYGPKCLVFQWSTKSRDLTLWIPDTHLSTI